jgi:hypothetical protein
MTHKCLDKEFCMNANDSLNRNHSDHDILNIDDSNEPRRNFLKLSEWILQTQDGDIKESEFLKLEHCLLTDHEALKYYVEFMQLCAGLHMMFNKIPTPSLEALHSSN